MNTQDDKANDEADRHANMMQERRKPKQVGTIGATDHKKIRKFYCAVAPLVWQKTGAEYEK